MSRRLRPKYQVFISSTYADLHDEREAVTWAILKSRQIPAGMENFSAHPDRGWKVIQRTVDSSDYYVLLIAGRYGEVDEATGVSWTEREYDYAEGRKMSILAFIRDSGSITANKMEKDPTQQERLAKFIGRVKAVHMYETWRESADLCQKVSNALLKQINDDEDEGKSPPGWYRGDQIPGTGTLDEFARLSAENERLKKEVAERTPSEPKLELWTLDEIPVAEKMEDYYDVIAREDNRLSFCLNLVVANTGTAVARDVVVDLRITGGGDVAPACKVEVFSPTMSYRRHPDGPAVIEGPSHGGLRIRIKSIGSRGNEPLPPLGVDTVIGPAVDSDCEAFDGELRYRLLTEDGCLSTGSVRLLLRVKSKAKTGEGKGDSGPPA